MDDLIQSPYEHMIVACLKHTPDEAEVLKWYVHCNERKLFEFAELHEVATIVALILENQGKSSPMWRTAAHDWRYRLTQRFEKLELFATTLKQAGIPLVALKNAAIARAICPIYENCPMGNFDCLVRFDDFAKAHEIALGLGFEPVAELDHALKLGVLEYRMDLADDTLWLKLLWKPFSDQWKLPQDLSERFFDGAKSEPDSDILIPDSVINLFHVCLNVAKHAYVCTPGLRMYTEIDRVVRSQEAFDWKRFLVLAKQVRLPIYFSLYLSNLLLDTPLNAEVMTALQPDKKHFERMMWVVRKAGLFYPEKALPFAQKLVMKLATGY